mgnify:CR=1 FL=1
MDQFIRTRQQLFEDADIFPESRMLRMNGPVENGGGSHSAEFISILKPLAERYTLYVVDRPGSGQTDFFNYRGVDVPDHGVKFIRSFMHATGLEKASFLSQSMGAYFNFWFALASDGYEISEYCAVKFCTETFR